MAKFKNKGEELDVSFALNYKIFFIKEDDR